MQDLKKIEQKLSQVELLALDVDGVLTDARIFLSDSGEWRRSFSIRDGYGIKKLKESGYKIAIITGSKAKDIKERAKVLEVDFLYEGFSEKLPALEKLEKDSGIPAKNWAYMGDDEFDIPVLERVGFAATVSDAMDKVFELQPYVAKRPAGNGAVRELCELILKFGARRTK
jgi:3-deoxy-D-manno-octulosonate 8-phosphate phosphatase (KDO 8-P phosphatase)